MRSRPDHGAAYASAEGALGTATAVRGPVSPRGIRHLRALGHALAPTVQIGKEGLTDAVVDAAKDALRAHELIKVRIGTEAPVERKGVGLELASRAGATLVQLIGRTLLLYKRHPHKPRIEVPR